MALTGTADPVHIPASDGPDTAPQNGTPAAVVPGSQQPLDAALSAVSDTLVRRGYLTTEFWVTAIGLVLSTVLGFAGVPGHTATQVVTIAGPVLLAVVYAVLRTVQKSRLSQIAADFFPQFTQNP